MTDLESLVRETLADEAQRAPLGRDLTARVDAGVRADRPGARAVVLAAAACVALAAVVGGATVLACRQPSSVQPGGSSATPAVTDTGGAAGATEAVPDGPLVTDGPCAGLTVHLAEPVPASQLVRTVRPLVRGAENRWHVGAFQVSYLQASGPCVEDLRYDVVEPPGQDRAQGPTGDVAQRFADGLGPLITHADSAGTATVNLSLDCPAGTYCADTGALLASVTLTVASGQGSDAPAGTYLPAPLTSTMYFTQSSTMTSSVGTGPVPPAGAETVTVMLEPTP